MQVDIYMPRLDVAFKKGPVPKERGNVAPIRQYWQDFCLTLRATYIQNGCKARVIEVPLWQINESLVRKTSINANIIFIPHKMKLNWLLDDRVRFYMQMVIPSLFSIDTDGWCASASYWPISYKKWESSMNTPDVFNKLAARIENNISKFEQPTKQKIQLPSNYVLFPCQLPHDETIRFHSDVSVEDSLQALLASLQTDHAYSVVIKGHPANPAAMESLRKIFCAYREKYKNTSLAEKIFWIDDISIHQALSNCKAVFTVNSGVGIEALLHSKKVFTFGSADYASAATKVIFGGKIQNAVLSIERELTLLNATDIASHETKCRAFVNSWYYTHYDCENISTFSKVVDLF